MALLALAAVPITGAAEQLTIPLAGVVTHPCTEEPVDLEGHLHFTFQDQGNGTFHVFFNAQGVSATELLTGVHYVAADNSKTFIYTSGFKITEYFRFVRSGEVTTTSPFGTGDDFYARMEFSSVGPPQVSLVCK